MISKITNNECLRGNATKITNFYHVTTVVIFQVKSWSDWSYLIFCTLATSLDSVKTKPSCLSSNKYQVFSTFLQFLVFVVQGESAESAKIFKSWRYFVFRFWSLKFAALIREITNNECLKGSITRISQFLSILVSRNPCFVIIIIIHLFKVDDIAKILDPEKIYIKLSNTRIWYAS